MGGSVTVLSQPGTGSTFHSYLDYGLTTVTEMSKINLFHDPERSNDQIFILLSGSVRISLASVNFNQIGQIGPGECVGEMSMLDSDKASAWVVTTEPSRSL
ncbi:MAG: cyclic nucleotide-binding domain-containing protein [Magnetococcales bacterium]|nr:cyclic nucleotide-binding domain-containing protein [Magnetococcales bacterium]